MRWSVFSTTVANETENLVQTKPLGKNTITNIMKVSGNFFVGDASSRQEREAGILIASGSGISSFYELGMRET